MAKPLLDNLTFSVVIALLVIAAPLVGLMVGYMPSKGIDPTVENNPIKFYLVIMLWFGIALAAIFNVVINIQTLFSKYGGNYNWATFKAILRGSKK